MADEDLKPVSKWLQIVHQYCLEQGASVRTPEIVNKIVTGQPKPSTDMPQALEICLCFMFADMAKANTYTSFDAAALKSKLAECRALAEEDNSEDLESTTLSERLSEVAKQLVHLQLDGRKLVSHFPNLGFQFARLTKLETSVAQRVLNMVSSGQRLDIEAINLATHLTDEQSDAVKSSLQSRFSVIIGGPGTGKTSIIVELLRAVKALGMSVPRMVLAAPTGKAAYRMGESIAKALANYNDASNDALETQLTSPKTLHRLLDYRPWSGEFGRHEQSPIAADLVIVDEASMIDLELFLSLCEALTPQAHLVLLGDPGQLPSVGNGAVLRDLVDSGVVNVSRLTKSFRMNESDPAGSKIYQASRAILVSPSSLSQLDIYEPDWLQWTAQPPKGIHCCPAALVDLSRFARAWYLRFYTDELWSSLQHQWLWTTDHPPEELTGIEQVFHRFNMARILCPTRHGPQGTIHLNNLFSQFVRADLDGPMLDKFGVGDLVICTRNDYRLELFNGDQGVVIANDADNSDAKLWVVFEGGTMTRIYPLSAVVHLLEHAFALTVHKSQGSEFDTVALVLSAQTSMTISKPLIYTAITRAKHEVLVLGKPVQMVSAAETEMSRFTTLSERIQSLQTSESQK